MISEIKRLHALGFALHWLHPNSKRPIESGWTTGPRKSLKELRSTYREGMNLGVRLGTPSKIADAGFLAVVDVDVKSTEPHHKKEALAAAWDALKGARCPIVLSGRGNGSRHYYCITEKPFKTWDVARSKETVKVLMPSKKASKAELAALSENEIAQGYRLAPAWEVSLYSDGRQVVLPPSIHPDSGKEYVWKRGIEEAADLPLVDFGQMPEAEEASTSSVPKKEKPFTADFKFEAVDFDLGLFDLSPKTVKAIVTGEDVEDRSAALLPVCKALYRAGADQNEILSILTQPKFYLSGCAYEHAQTKDRARAAYWLYRYTLAKIIEENSADAVYSQFAKIEQAPELSGEALAAQTAEMEEGVLAPSETGFYVKGPRGALKPAYDALLETYKEEHPYRTIADMKTIFTFNGTHYEETTPIDVKCFAERMMSPKPEESMRTEFFAKVLANHVDHRTFFTETTEGRVNFKNGVLDLNAPDAELKSHSPEYGFRGVLPFDYDPEARCPAFYKWLKGVMLGDRELIAVVQEYMGYIVRGGDYKYHKALWLGGVGRNGKSTFIDLLKALIGAGNFSVLSIKALIQDKFAGAALDGKIANFSEETSPQELADSGPFKNLTGDGDLFAQKKYGDPYSFRNRAKLIMTYNQIPDLKDLSPGMLSRPLIIPFEKIIGEEEQDRGIKQKLFKELPGIFNFALRGWNRLEQQGGFTESGRSKAALDAVKAESCGVYQWAENNLVFVEPIDRQQVPAPNSKDKMDNPTTFRPARLYGIYCQREKYPFKMIEFCRRLNAHPKIIPRHDRDGVGVKYHGLIIPNLTGG